LPELSRALKESRPCGSLWRGWDWCTHAESIGETEGNCSDDGYSSV
jgi:hypothetical protein